MVVSGDHSSSAMDFHYYLTNDMVHIDEPHKERSVPTPMHIDHSFETHIQMTDFLLICVFVWLAGTR